MSCKTMTAPSMNGDGSSHLSQDSSSSFTSSSRHSRSKSSDSVASVVFVHPPTPDGKVPESTAVFSARPSPASRSSSTSTYSSRMEDAISGQNVRPPRRIKRTSPSGSPLDSPRGSRTSSPVTRTDSPLPSSMKKKAGRFEELSPSSSASVTPTSTVAPAGTTLPTVPPPTSPASPSSHYFPPQRRSANQTTRPSLNPAANSFNTRRAAAGRPTLVSMSTETASVSALKLNLENLGRPRFDPTSQSFITDKDAPHTTSGVIRSSPLIRKKSGELVKSSLKVSMAPSYDANPLSASSNASTDYSSSPFAGSKSLPTTPSCPKYVHFDTRLERVRLFLSEQKPAAVSRSTSPTDDNGGLGGSGSEGGEFPFPTTSDEEENARKSLEIYLPNFPVQQPFDSDLYVVSISLTDDAKNLRGIIHVRNIAFNKRVSVRFTSDSWSTTSEVTATFQDSIKGGTFDRFSFVIKLQDMARLEEKKLFLAVRYSVDGREIWDSNAGQNYQIEFRRSKAMKASELREARKAARGPGGKGSEWSDKGGNGGPSADRMADLKLQLSRLAADDYDEDGIAALAPPKALLSPNLGPGSPLAARYDFGASLKNTKAGSSPSTASSYSRNYGTGWDGSPPSAERQLSEISPDGRNGTMLGAGAYPSQSFGSTPAPAEGGAMGLRFDPSLSFGSPGPSIKSPLPRLDGLPPSSISNFDRTHPSSFGSPREPDSFAFASRSIPTQPDPSSQQTLRTLTPGGTFSPTNLSSSLSSTSSISSMSSISSSNSSQGSSHSHSSSGGRNHSRSAYGTQSLDYFSAASVRRTPPASPRVEGMGSLTNDGGAAGTRLGGSRFNSFPTGRGQASPYSEIPPSLPRNTFMPSSSSFIGAGGDLDSPVSQSSTPSMTASSGGTPNESPMSPPPYPLSNGYDPSLSMPRQGSLNLSSVSYSDFVNQYCFFTGGPGSSTSSSASTAGSDLLSPGGIDDNFRSPTSLPSIHPSTSSSSVDSFFSAGPSSGFTTPTNPRSPAAQPVTQSTAGYFGAAGLLNKGQLNGHDDGTTIVGSDQSSVTSSEGLDIELEEDSSATPKGGRSPHAASGGGDAVRV